MADDIEHIERLIQDYGKEQFSLEEIDIMIERHQDAINMRLETLKALYNMRAYILGVQRVTEVSENTG